MQPLRLERALEQVEQAVPPRRVEMGEERPEPDQVELALETGLARIVGRVDRLGAEGLRTEVDGLRKDVARGQPRLREGGLELAQDAAVPGAEVEDPAHLGLTRLEHREPHPADRRAAGRVVRRGTALVDPVIRRGRLDHVAGPDPPEAQHVREPFAVGGVERSQPGARIQPHPAPGVRVDFAVPQHGLVGEEIPERRRPRLLAGGAEPLRLGDQLAEVDLSRLQALVQPAWRFRHRAILLAPMIETR